MTDKLDPQSRKAIVAYRIERAYKTLDEVEILVNNELFSTAINRLYYAVYYAAIALMVKDGITATSHAGVRSMLGLLIFEPAKSAEISVAITPCYLNVAIAAIMMISSTLHTRRFVNSSL